MSASAAAGDPSWSLPIGSTLADGRYQVLSVLGRGGFGITYEVGDRRLRRRVAIKELVPPDAVRHGEELRVPPGAEGAFDAQRQRFLREARVLARFTHPGIVRVYEVFEEHGTAHLVMERLDGRTLVDVLVARGAPFTEEEVLDVAARVAAALRPVHAAGVLHRDINPANVMLAAHGRIVVIDFGLARDYDEHRTVGMTRVVTPGYAPIEQYRGEARFGPATDVYGLAATCYRLATGRIPPSAVDREGGVALEAVHQLNPSISKAVSDAIADGLEVEPSHRPADLDALLARLGVRKLPDGSPSVLAGSPGAEVAPVAAGSTSLDVELLPGDAPADPPRADPEPRLAPPTVASSPSEGSDATVIVGPGPRPDVDATAVPGIAVVPDATRADTATGRAADPDATRSDATRADATRADDVGVLGAPPASSEDRAGTPTRRWVATVPPATALVGLGAALPVAATALTLLVVLPALATAGDREARRLRTTIGMEPTWADRRLPPSLGAAGRFVRNLAASVLRSSPIVGVAAVVLGGWYLLDATSLSGSVTDALLRLVGAGTVAALLASAREGTAGFRSGLGIDRLAAWIAPGGRVTERVVVAWILAVVVVVACLWLHPDPLPLP